MAEEQNTETENTPQAKQQDWTDRIEVRGTNGASSNAGGDGDSKILNQEEIDNINILNATKLALTKAISEMKIKPDLILVDALEHIDTLRNTLQLGNKR